MTDFKSAAEQQVREALGWWIKLLTFTGGGDYTQIQRRDGFSQIADRYHEAAYNALVSKTAELLEMTAQRDGANKATTDLLNLHDDALIRAETAEKQRDEAQRALELAERQRDGANNANVDLLHLHHAAMTRAESAEATIREQAERITKMRDALETIEASLCACRKLICNRHACFSKRTAAEALRGKQ